MVKTQQKLLKVSEIKTDDRLYPRMGSDFKTVARYYNAIKSGAKFPPIVVASTDRGNILIDGKHRLEATKGCKITHIQAEVKSGLTDKEIYLEAVKSNMTHGRQFSTQEVTQIAVTLKDMDMNLNEISEIVRIPADKLNEFVASRISRITESGRDIALKKSLYNVFGGLPMKEEENVEYKQIKLNGRTQIRTVEILTSLLKNNWIEDSETLHTKLKTLKRYIDKYLEQEIKPLIN